MCISLAAVIRPMRSEGPRGMFRVGILESAASSGTMGGKGDDGIREGELPEADPAGPVLGGRGAFTSVLRPQADRKTAISRQTKKREAVAGDFIVQKITAEWRLFDPVFAHHPAEVLLRMSRRLLLLAFVVGEDKLGADTVAGKTLRQRRKRIRSQDGT